MLISHCFYRPAANSSLHSTRAQAGLALHDSTTEAHGSRVGDTLTNPRTAPRTANNDKAQALVAIMLAAERASDERGYRVLISTNTRASSSSSSTSTVCVNLLPERQPPLIAKHTPVGKGHARNF